VIGGFTAHDPVPQFAVAATSHSARSSDEMRSVELEMRSDEVDWIGLSRV